MFPPQHGKPQSKMPPPKPGQRLSRDDKPTDQGIPAGLADADTTDDNIHHATSIDRNNIADLAEASEEGTPDDSVNDPDVDALSEIDPEASTVAKDPEQKKAAARTRPQMNRVKNLPGGPHSVEQAAASLAHRQIPKGL